MSAFLACCVRQQQLSTHLSGVVVWLVGDAACVCKREAFCLFVSLFIAGEACL